MRRFISVLALCTIATLPAAATSSTVTPAGLVTPAACCVY
jgi:hypothetical protein